MKLKIKRKLLLIFMVIMIISSILPNYILADDLKDFRKSIASDYNFDLLKESWTSEKDMIKSKVLAKAYYMLSGKEDSGNPLNITFENLVNANEGDFNKIISGTGFTNQRQYDVTAFSFKDLKTYTIKVGETIDVQKFVDTANNVFIDMCPQGNKAFPFIITYNVRNTIVAKYGNSNETRKAINYAGSFVWPDTWNTISGQSTESKALEGFFSGLSSGGSPYGTGGLPDTTQSIKDYDAIWNENKNIINSATGTSIKKFLQYISLGDKLAKAKDDQEKKDALKEHNEETGDNIQTDTVKYVDENYEDRVNYTDSSFYTELQNCNSVEEVESIIEKYKNDNNYKMVQYFDDSLSSATAAKHISKFVKKIGYDVELSASNMGSGDKYDYKNLLYTNSDGNKVGIEYWVLDEFPYKNNKSIKVFSSFIIGKDNEDKAETISEIYGLGENAMNMDTRIIMFISGDSEDLDEEEIEVEFKDVFDDVNEFVPEEDPNEVAEIKEPAETVFGVIWTVGIILSVLIIAVLGLKYMFMSLEERADFKGTMIPYLIGAGLLFSISSIAGILYEIGKSFNF